MSAEADRLLNDGQLSPRLEKRLLALRAGDREELRDRRAERQIPRDERQARQLLKDALPSDRLGNRALRQRIRDSRALLNSGDLRPETRRRLRRLEGKSIAVVFDGVATAFVIFYPLQLGCVRQ